MKRVLFVILLFSITTSFSQESASKFKIQSFSVGSGVNHFKADPNSFNDLKSLATSNQEIFDVDLNLFTKSQMVEHCNEIDFMLGLKSQNSLKNKELLIGLKYRYGDRRNLHYFHNYAVPADTSVISDVSMYSDSSIMTAYNYINEITELGITLAQLYKTSPDRRIQVYSGFGTGLYFSLFSDINKQYFTDTSLVFYIDGEHYFHSSLSRQVLHESHYATAKAKSNITVSSHIPIGISCSFSRKKKDQDQTQLFIQSKFGVEYQFVFNHKDYLRPFVGFIAGLRYRFA